MRSWFRSERGMDPVQESVPASPPNIIEAKHVKYGHADEEERKSDGSTLMDWSGLDYVRKIYVGRKSRVGL